MQGYDRYILKELNHFRRKHHYRPYIRWQNMLASTGFFFFPLFKCEFTFEIIKAGREGQSIIKKRSFGEHANFRQWRRKVNNRFFTELALRVDTEGRLPSKRIFAKVIEPLN